MPKVLVTGATGFIATHTIVQLVQAGYDVRGTVRSKSRQAGLIETLSRYAGHPVDLELVEADLTADTGWEEAVAGCQFVQHLASPLPSVLPKDPEELIAPARDGALRVLRAAHRSGNIKRVVLTSSNAAIAYGWGDQRPKVLTEEHWSNPDNLADNTAYTRSKTIAEKAAWDYVHGEGKGLELTTINPVAVLGPAMSKDVSASMEIVMQILSGNLPAIPKIGFQIVDVRDVAEAHVKAMTSDAAVGERFVVAEEFYWFSEIAEILREAYPDRKIAKWRLPSALFKLIARFNPVLRQVVPELERRRFASWTKATQLLDWHPRPAREAILASAESLIRYDAV